MNKDECRRCGQEGEIRDLLCHKCTQEVKALRTMSEPHESVEEEQVA